MWIVHLVGFHLISPYTGKCVLLVASHPFPPLFTLLILLPLTSLWDSRVSCFGSEVLSRSSQQTKQGWIDIVYLFPQSSLELMKLILFQDTVNCSQNNSIIWWVPNNCYSISRYTFSIQLLPIRETIWPTFPCLAYFTEDNQLNSTYFPANDKISAFFLAQ